MIVNPASVQSLKTELQSLNPDSLQGSSNLLAAFRLANQSFQAPLGDALQVKHRSPLNASRRDHTICNTKKL
jgi:hypothetical protein